MPLATVHAAGNPTGCGWAGAHAHIEVFNYHGWGDQYEWHNDVGPESYAGLPYISDHEHICNWGQLPCPGSGDEPNMGYDQQVIDAAYFGFRYGYLGDATTSFAALENPYSGTH